MSENETFNLERVESNLMALAELKKTYPDRNVLGRYSGWGGLRDAVYHRDTYKQLKHLLSDVDISAIKKTFKSAYYTPECLVEFVYGKLDTIDLSPQRILEPSAGHGIFIKKMPTSWKDAKWTVVEMDSVSCQLLRTLYPHVDVRHQGFEHFQDDTGFDLIIGNPPYGQFSVKDAQHLDLAHVSIHHYFVGKCMRLLKPEGLLAMVLPRYFLDASEKHVRHIIAKEGGSLVEAYRLPDDLFLDAKVTVDVVILQKRAGNMDWGSTRTFQEGARRANMNTYFFQHPEKIIGKIEFISVYGRDELTCKRTENVEGLFNEETALDGNGMHEGFSQVTRQTGTTPCLMPTLHTRQLQAWENTLEKQLAAIEAKKQQCAETLTVLEQEGKECQRLLLMLREHCLEWQTLSNALMAMEATVLPPSNQDANRLLLTQTKENTGQTIQEKQYN